MSRRRGSVAVFDGPEVYRRRFKADPAIVAAGRRLAADCQGWESCGAAAVAALEYEEAESCSKAN